VFTKSDVKENDWVVLRNGKVFRALKLNDEFVLVSEDEWNLLESYRDTLLWPASPPHKLDIMKIIRPTKVTDLFASCYQYGKTVFDRDKGIGCEPTPKFKAGDLVKVVTGGDAYVCDSYFVKENAPHLIKHFIDWGSPHTNAVFRVEAVANDSNRKHFKYVIQDVKTKQVFVVPEDELEEIE
jgi:hypothetical protein